MGYIQENLLPNEKILFTAKINPIAVFMPSFLFCLMSLYPLWMYQQDNQQKLVANVYLCLLGFLWLYTLVVTLEAVVTLFTTEFAVTNRRVIAKKGFIRRHTIEIFLHKVESVRVNQNILQRILNFGSVTVTGTGGTSESFRAITNPVGVRRKINQVIEKYGQQPNAQ